MITNILKKAITFSVLLLLIVSSTAFTTNKETANIEGLDYYFFLEYTPGTTSDYSKTRYISSFIYYAGYDECGNDYDFKPKAQRAFESFIKANYNESYVKHTKTYDQKRNSTDKIKTQQQANEVLDKYIADQNDKGNDVIQTTFSYSCE